VINKKEEEPIMNSMSFKIVFVTLAQYDHLVKPHILTDEDGQIALYGDYEPFGKVNMLVERTTNNFRFPGQYFIEETGLYYNWWRWYKFNIGSYLQIDLLGKEFDNYKYVGSNPIMFYDLKGLEK